MEGFGLEEELGLGRRVGKSKFIAQYTKDNRPKRVINHEFEPSAEVDASRPPS